MARPPTGTRHSIANQTFGKFNLAISCPDLDPADKLSLLASTDSAEDPGRVEEARRTHQAVPAASIHRPNYPDGFWFLPLNTNVGDSVKLASLLPFFLAIWLQVLYLSFVNPFLCCLNGIDSFSTSTTTK